MNLKSLAVLWLAVGCASAMATKPPSSPTPSHKPPAPSPAPTPSPAPSPAPTPSPAPAPASTPVANVVGTVASIGTLADTTHYHLGNVMWTIPKGQPDGSYDEFTDVYGFTLSAAELVTATASVVGNDRRNFALVDGVGQLALYDGVYVADTGLSGYHLEREILFGADAGSLVQSLASGNYFFVVEGTTAGDKGGKYSFAVSADDIVTAVPEPGGAALLLAGLGLVGTLAWRRRLG